MKRLERVPLLPLLAGDALLSLAAYRLAFRIRELVPIPGTRDLLPPQRFDVVDHRWIALALLALTGVVLVGLHRDLEARRPRELASGAVGAAGLAALGLVALYFFAADPVFPRTVVPLYWSLFAAGLLGLRTVALSLVRPPRIRTVLVGRSTVAARLAAELAADPGSRRRLVGVLREEGDDDEAPTFAGLPVLGGLEAAPRLVAAGEVDEILLAPGGDWRDRLLGEITRLEGAGVRVNVVPSLYEVLLGKLAHVPLRDRPLLEVVRDPGDPLSDALRRALDIALVLLLALPALAVGLAAAAAVRLGSRGPALFRQTRVGRGGRPFPLLKFRTMVVDAERETGAVLAAPDDPRITPVGEFLRRSRIDEIPQLWNVLSGQMSFVGPRPERPEFVALYEAEIPGYSHRHRVRPGITGLAQVRGDYHTEPDVKLMYDLVYVCNRSLGLDLQILVETVRTVLFGRGAA